MLGKAFSAMCMALSNWPAFSLPYQQREAAFPVSKFCKQGKQLTFLAPLAFLLKGLQNSVNGDLPWVTRVLIPTLQQADRMASLSTDQTQPITPPQSGGREHPRPDSTKLPADPSRSWSREGSLLLSILRAGNQPSHFYTVTQKQSRISSCIRNRSFLHSHNLNNFKTRNALASLLQT